MDPVPAFLLDLVQRLIGQLVQGISNDRVGAMNHVMAHQARGEVLIRTASSVLRRQAARHLLNHGGLQLDSQGEGSDRFGQPHQALVKTRSAAKARRFGDTGF